MSLVLDLAARLRSTAEDLPVAQLTAAVERLRLASVLLAYVLREAADPAAVPTLASAETHLTGSVAALHATRRAIDDYLAAIGVAGSGPPPAEPHWPEPVEDAPVPADEKDGGEAPKLGNWWVERVCLVTDGSAERGRTDPVDSTDLLRRVAGRARAQDRSGLRTALVDVDPAVGLSLAATAPPLLRQLAAELVGRTPTPEDLPKVTEAVAPRLRDVLPKLPESTAAVLLARVCHAEEARREPAGQGGQAEPAHPVDAAVTAGAAVGALLAALGRDVDSLKAKGE